MSSRKRPATIAVTGAISKARPSASPMPAMTAAIRPSQPAQPGRPGSSASIQGSASHSNSSFSPNQRADEGEQRQAEGLEKDRAELRRKELAGGGAGSVEDHGRGFRFLGSQIGEAEPCDKNAGKSDLQNALEPLDPRAVRVSQVQLAPVAHPETCMTDFDVLCIGNAIVDIIAQCDDAFLTENGIIKGAMNLIDTDRANLLYSRMGPATEASGGCAGNTAAGIASLGGRAAFFGKVANDELGRIYAHDIHAQGVAFDTRPLKGQPPTARSMIFVTPDGERSMNTYLGACVELGPGGCRGGQGGRIEGDLFRGLSLGPAAGEGGDPPDG